MSVLAEIVARKRADLIERKAARPLKELENIVQPTDRSLFAALKQPGMQFILECKKASPSEGLIRPHFDPAELADAYAPFAAGISVLTDEPYFQGSFEYLKTVRERVKQPVLCKDFIVEPYQIFEARANTADAVLLMLSVLSDEEYRECHAAAQSLGMDSLTEVHDEAELERALALDAKIVGINNRDLKTLKIDLEVTKRLAPKISRERAIVCESGLRSRADLDAVVEWVDAYLVGSHLMKSERVDLETRRLIFGQVKVCGLTSREDLQTAYEAGASLGGLIFAPESPRVVSEAVAETMAADSPIPLVGVFVNENAPRISDLASRLSLYAVQLHGDEDAAFITQLRGLLPENCQVWKAVQVRDRIPSFSEYGADFLLLDTYSNSARGGTGSRFNWDLVRQHPDRQKFILAGGLNPGNIFPAHALGCAGLDVNSGVESAPGVKDPALLKALFDHLRGA